MIFFDYVTDKTDCLTDGQPAQLSTDSETDHQSVAQVTLWQIAPMGSTGPGWNDGAREKEAITELITC